jgi:2-polyprenyl-3-methyl-5-hydroxy-6-metoxy-1,4-benzoquinol methylase
VLTHSIKWLYLVVSYAPASKLKGIIMKIFYDKQTINTPNPIARFAHRNRLARVISLIKSQVGLSKLIDYGCGSGAFIKAIQGINGIAAIGYEPFMTERVDTDSPIYSDYLPVKDAAPFDAITIFEAIEHLDETELCEFLVQATELLTDNGKILFSAPIEIGPALFLKEINRCILHKRLIVPFRTVQARYFTLLYETTLLMS